MKTKYAIAKKGLSKAELLKLVKAVSVRKAIADNQRLGLKAPAIRNKKGIFQFPDYEKQFTFDGSIILRDPPEDVWDRDAFFAARGRLLKMGASTFLLRGPQYLISIDPTKEVRQRLSVLTQNFYEAVVAAMSVDDATKGTDFLIQSATLDYAKNSAVTIFNAIVQGEKTGKFRLDDHYYQSLRLKAFEVAKYATWAHYAHLIGEEGDKASCLQALAEKFDDVAELPNFLEGEYLEGIFSSRHFTRPEASHPLLIATSMYVSAMKAKPLPDTVIGLPSGGTELAFAQVYAFKHLLDHTSDLILVPLSLHSIKKLSKGARPDKEELGKYLEMNRHLLDSRDILLVEDNSSTGRTIQMLTDMLSAHMAPHKVDVSVAEADLIRSELDMNSRKRTYIASPRVYDNSIGILPVSRHMQPKTDLKEIAEFQRLMMVYQRALKSSTNLTNKVLNAAFVRMHKEPTEDILPKLDDKNAVLSFRGTFLSNFYAIPITYRGKTYESIEHAYQAQKFKKSTLQSVSKECLDEINEVLRARGSLHEFESAENIFTTELLSSGNAKLIADVLRQHDYVREDWDDRKMPLMAELLLQKFQHPELKELLLRTGDKYLVEGNTWQDTLWGVCEGRGRNLLGLLLMEIRDNVLRNEMVEERAH